MQPHGLFTTLPPAKNSPAPLNSKLFLMSLLPSPFSKIWVLINPENSPAVVICINRTRLFSSGNPFGVPFKTYHAPPVKSDISMSCPSRVDPAEKAETHGWESLSTTLISASSPWGWEAIPIVTQLSAARSGKKPSNPRFMDAAVVPPNVLL